MKHNPHAGKTHCKRGHEFTPANTRLRPKGRECRECIRLRKRAYRKKLKDETARAFQSRA